METQDENRLIDNMVVHMEARGYVCVVIGVSQTLEYIKGGSEQGLAFLDNKSHLVTEFINFIREDPFSDKRQSLLQLNSPEESQADYKEQNENELNTPLYFTESTKQELVNLRHNPPVSSELRVDLSIDKAAEKDDTDNAEKVDTDNLVQNEANHVSDLGTKSKKFQCETCGALCISKLDLDAHRKNHRNDPFTTINCVSAQNSIAKNKNFQCEKCGSLFRLKSLLEAHRNRLLPCICTTSVMFDSMCDETVHYEDSNGIMTSITVSKALEILKTECFICSFKTRQLSNLRRHFILVHCKEKTFKCNYCTLSFKLEYSLNKHLLNVHAAKQFSAFTCDLCKKTFSSVKHLKFHKVFKCIKRLKPNKCELCDYTTKSNAIMLAHQRVHTGEKTYKCPHCEISLATKNGLQQHLDLHSEDRKYECKHCGMKFKTRAPYYRHMKSHNGGTAHQCSVCGREFGYKSTLQYHMMTHSGSKPFVCETCGEAFRKKERLSAHKQQRHSEVKCYHCQICKKAFATTDSLRVHTLIHGERSYTCDRCGKSFYRRGKLTQHYKIHNKRYNCEQCTSKFTSLTDLKRHSREHQQTVEKI